MRELSNPPDPNPKKPKLAMPLGACDCHIHLFGPAEKFPVDPLSPYESRDQLAETNIALQERLGLSRAVVVSGGAYGRNYAVLEDALKRFPQRYRGVALMPDDTTDAEFARLTRLGVRGLRFISSARGMRQVPTLSEAVAARAGEHGWHVQFYPQQTDIIDNADRLLALPNRIVLDHFASVPAEGGIDQPAFKTVLRMLDSGRVWLKLSGPMRCSGQEYPYANVAPLARAGGACTATAGVGLGLAARQYERSADAERRRSRRSDRRLDPRRGDAPSHPGGQPVRALRLSHAGLSRGLPFPRDVAQHVGMNVQAYVG